MRFSVEFVDAWINEKQIVQNLEVVLWEKEALSMTFSVNENAPNPAPTFLQQEHLKFSITHKYT